MIEIGFNGSFVGNMEAADADYHIFDEDSVVLMLEFILDIGYIDNDITSDYRTDLPEELYMFHQFDNDGDIEFLVEDNDSEYFGQVNLKEWARFIRCVDDGMDVRIWVSHTAESMCGLLHLCSYLVDKPNKVFVVDPPRFIPGWTRLGFLNGWEQCHPEDLARYISNTQELNREEIHIFSERWNVLKKENAPLRALISGNVVSVEEDFYDFILRKNIPDGEFRQSDIIRDFYEDDVSVGTYWLDRRVEHMIEEGELHIVKDSKDQYKRILKRGNG